MVVLMMAMMTGNPAIAGIPGLFEAINKTKERVNPVQAKAKKQDKGSCLGLIHCMDMHVKATHMIPCAQHASDLA